MSALLAEAPGAAVDLDALLPDLTAAFAATAAEHDRDSSFPFENFAALHRHGLLALTAPPRLGGGGADLPTTLKVVQAVARGEPATALVLTMQYLFHASLDGRGGFTDDLKARVVRDAVEHGALINALRVEPELGTPARGGLPATIARRTADGWSLSGRKIYSTGSPALTWMIVWARTDEDTPRVGGFLVHRDAPGRRIEETWDHTGLRASGSHDVIFENTPIPEHHALAPRLPSAPQPPDPAMAVWSPVLTAAIYDAVARSARDWFVQFLLDRKPANLGESLATLPRFQELVGQIDGLLLQNRVLLESAAEGRLGAAHGGLVKHLVTENAIAAVEKAIAATGNPGLSRANPLQRHYRDVLCGRVHTPQADIVLTGAGKAAFASLASN
ncbi:acyl-CoA dehydrogenase family protein [Phenylobacterium sp. Root700]|uniref:acyl-CoA dehydrogenase family protein n=1 Tax=Phenylobacterium sp. Root700 TaxID=1736591 RepID=UPI0006F2A4B6|nr:acyl-CoA dehydrogenase family protein [Phenylobacterium sp. Root700]KRB49457.1 acyl-CoA dehydrogenase [Phenylobacterium sp. Root700]